GNLSPYHKAPVPDGLNETLPGDCSVDQVMLMGRHGSRWPLSSELEYIVNLTEKLSASWDYVQNADLPESMLFLKEGYTTCLGHDNLTATGRKQLFDHGVAFKLKYPNLTATTVLAGDQDRVVESAQWFSMGYFGRDWFTLQEKAFDTIAEDEETISWITPMDTCAKWSYASFGDAPVDEWGAVYLPNITARLNDLIPGLNLTDDDTHGALYACAYDYAAYETSPWCDVFTESELGQFEYELDLLMAGAFGYNLPGSMGPTIGSLFVNKLIDRFTNATGDAVPLYLEFGHDTTIDLALTALGLAKDAPRLSSTAMPEERKWRTSDQVPFAAQMIWEKFSCTSSFEGPQVRLILNDSPFPLLTCANSDEDKLYGSCALDAFVAANGFSTTIAWGDDKWKKTCGASDL
ncbi:histidine phosphatase superfamily, partial [Schizophyllum fasciatum]